MLGPRTEKVVGVTEDGIEPGDNPASPMLKRIKYAIKKETPIAYLNA